MKRHNFLSKTIVCALTIGMSMALFAGCQSNSTTTQAATTTSTQSSKKTANRPTADEMKKRIQDSIQPLITAGTITQAQGDKIIAAYTTRPTGDGQKSKTPDQKSNQQGNTQNGSQNKQRFNPLTKLVSDGTITQAQADAVTQKMKENSTHKNNGQSSQNTNGQSSN